MGSAVTAAERTCTGGGGRSGGRPYPLRRGAVAVAWPLVAALLYLCDIVSAALAGTQRRLARMGRPFGY